MRLWYESTLYQTYRQDINSHVYAFWGGAGWEGLRDELGMRPHNVTLAMST